MSDILSKPSALIGVDLEGIHLKDVGISLVQVILENRKIYLFRTGLNKELWTKGDKKMMIIAQFLRIQRWNFKLKLHK